MARLHSFFASGQFVTWNEPDLASPWHFTHVEGEGWRAGPIVDGATLDGRAVGQRIRHGELARGGTLRVRLR